MTAFGQTATYCAVITENLGTQMLVLTSFSSHFNKGKDFFHSHYTPTQRCEDNLVVLSFSLKHMLSKPRTMLSDTNR